MMNSANASIHGCCIVIRCELRELITTEIDDIDCNTMEVIGVVYTNKPAAASAAARSRLKIKHAERPTKEQSRFFYCRTSRGVS
jgi:hypothetical protein